MKERFDTRHTRGRRIPKRVGLTRNEKGFSLVEVVVAIAVFSVFSVALLNGLIGARKTTLRTDERQTAITLAQHQLEYVKQQSYLTSYTPALISSAYTGYSVTINTGNVASRDSNIQQIIITVSFQGTPIIMAPNCTLQGYKVN